MDAGTLVVGNNAAFGRSEATRNVIHTIGAALATVSQALPAGHEVKVDSMNMRILVRVSGYNSWVSGICPGVTDPAIIGMASIEAGKPALSAFDWTYRTFKLPTAPKDFLRAVIISQP